MGIEPCDRNVLIVDDSRDIATLIAIQLESHGFTTTTASDGESALQLLSGCGFALVIMDIRMPKMSGLEALQHISDIGCDTAVIMMTAHGTQDLAVECMKIGAVDYFSKPFDLDDMLQRVERAIINRRILIEKRRLESEKEDFFYMLSHDLKNPIAAIIGSIDITREGRLGPVNPEQEEYLQSAIDSCNDVVAMIDNMLDVQRYAEGKMPARIASHDPASIAESAVRRFARAAEHDRITLAVESSRGIPAVAVDRGIMGRVLANLISNAIKYTPENGNITVSCDFVPGNRFPSLQIPERAAPPADFPRENGLVRFTVSDTGSGIPPDELGSIFERFTQSRHAGRIRSGSGLGLAFCKLAVENFNGIIWAESTEGSGSSFIILLPSHEPDTPKEGTS